MTSGTDVLRLAGLCYRVGQASILNGVDLAVAAGEVVGLIGPNGAGKSTVLKCVSGLHAPTAGEIALAGRPASALRPRERARLVSYVPQQAPSDTALTVVEMVGLGRAPHRGLSASGQDRTIVADALDRFGLTGLALRPFTSLSGGERQRVLLARAIAQGGRLLLLDEPTSALDLRHQLETMHTVRALSRARQIGVLVAIHDLALACRFSDRLVLMRGGAVVASGPWRDVLVSRHVTSAYGVDAIIGTDQDLPYVIPTHVQDGVRS